MRLIGTMLINLKNKDMIDFRCKWCGKLLSKICIEKGKIEIKCPNKECKRNRDKGINSYSFGYKYEDNLEPEKDKTFDMPKREEIPIE